MPCRETVPPFPSKMQEYLRVSAGAPHAAVRLTQNGKSQPRCDIGHRPDCLPPFCLVPDNASLADPRFPHLELRLDEREHIPASLQEPAERRRGVAEGDKG